MSRLFPTQMLKESIATLKANTGIFKDWNKMHNIEKRFKINILCIILYILISHDVCLFSFTQKMIK